MVISDGSYTKKTLEISIDQYQMLMQGLKIVVGHPIEEVSDPEFFLWLCEKCRK